jgi:zinc transport system ATP-binding protein
VIPSAASRNNRSQSSRRATGSTPAVGSSRKNRSGSPASALAALKERRATVVLVAHELGPLAPLVDRAVVMRDGRMVYDGAPLRDHEAHEPWFGEPHTHHHHQTRPTRPDHAPQVASPLDRPDGTAR